MHAYLMISRNTTETAKVVKELAKKLESKILPFTLEKIDDSRELKKQTKFSFNEKTAILIKDIDNATTEALNAFLKSLEEPNKNLSYILTAKTLENVLPTIVSRCEIIKINPTTGHNNDSVEVNEIVSKFANGNLDNRFEMISSMKDREEVINFIENLINFERKNRNYKYMEIYLKTLKNLKLNGNVALHLTNLVVTMNR